MRNLFWMRRTMSLYPSCLMLSEPVFCSSATIARISGMDSRTIFCSSFNRRFSIARILLSAHCGYSGSIFDFFVIEERPVIPGPLFFTGISTSLSFWEPSSLCRHQKDPASPSVQARSGRNAVYGSALALSWNRPEHFAAVC